MGECLGLNFYRQQWEAGCYFALGRVPKFSKIAGQRCTLMTRVSASS